VVWYSIRWVGDLFCLYINLIGTADFFTNHCKCLNFLNLKLSLT
jgi:hypothetical protein